MSIFQDLILYFIQTFNSINPADIIYVNISIVPLLYILIQGYLGGRILKNIRDIMKIEAVVPDSPEWTYYTYWEILRDIIIMSINPVIAVAFMIMGLIMIPEAAEAAMKLSGDILKISWEVVTMNAWRVLTLSFLFYLWRIFTETTIIEENGKVIEI